MVSDDSVVVAIREQISAGSGSAVELLCLKTGQHFTLDGAGGRIWNFIQAPRKVREIQDLILEEYDEVDSRQCRRDLLEFLEALTLEGLVEVLP